MGGMDNRTTDFFMKKSHREMKECRRLAERNDKLKLYAEICASLNSALTAIVMELQEIRIDQSKNKPGAGVDPQPGQSTENEN